MFVRISLRYLGQYWRALTLVVVLQIIQAGAALYLPKLNADIIDKGVVSGDIGYIWSTGGIMLAITALQAVAAVLIAYFGARTAMSVGRDLRRDVVGRVQSFGTLEISKFTPPSLITRATNDVQQIQMTLVMTFMIMIQAPVMMVGGVVMGLDRGESLEDSLRYGVAAGGASVMTDGTQLIKVSDFEALLPKVTLQEL